MKKKTRWRPPPFAAATRQKLGTSKPGNPRTTTHNNRQPPTEKENSATAAAGRRCLVGVVHTHGRRSDARTDAQTHARTRAGWGGGGWGTQWTRRQRVRPSTAAVHGRLTRRGGGAGGWCVRRPPEATPRAGPTRSGSFAAGSARRFAAGTRRAEANSVRPLGRSPRGRTKEREIIFFKNSVNSAQVPPNPTTTQPTSLHYRAKLGKTRYHLESDGPSGVTQENSVKSQ